MAGRINTYAYVRGNPISQIDPYGLWDWPSWAAGHEGQIGVGVTAFGVIKGGSAGISLGVSDTGLTLNLQGCGGVGGGAFLGAGIAVGIEKRHLVQKVTA